MVSNATTKKKVMAMAKPSFKHLWNFGKGTLKISGSTMDFLMYLSPFIDYDYKVNISLEDVCCSLDIQPNTLKRILWECTYNCLLVENAEGDYYSNFHIVTDGTSGKREYVKLLSVFSSAAVRNLSLREKRLFYYFVTVTVIGYWQEINIENLYKNKLHTNDRVGVNYFCSYSEVRSALIKLVESGLIDLELKQRKDNLSVQVLKKTAISATRVSTASELDKFVSFDSSQRKARTTVKQALQHTIRVRINPVHASSILKVCASEIELAMHVRKQSISWEDLSEKSIRLLIDFKNELYGQLGLLGLNLYRKCLNEYLSDKAGMIAYYDDKEKLANYFMDYYVLKEIELLLTATLSKQSEYKNTSINCSSSYSWAMNNMHYLLNQQSLSALLKYYQVRASINHKIELDAALEVNNLSLENVSVCKGQWDSIKEEVYSEIINRKVEVENKVYARSLVSITLDFSEWRKYMHQLASHGLFLKTDLLSDELEKQTNNYVESLPIKNTVPTVEFYNWLEERD